jgi:hypothetical protein
VAGKVLTVSERVIEPKPLDLASWCKRSATDQDYSELISENTLIRLPNGQPLILYVRLGGLFDFAKLKATLSAMRYDTSERSAGLKTTSRVFGYQPRITLRRDFCTATSLAAQDQAANEMLCQFGREVSPIYERYFPSRAAEHNAQAAKVLPEWRIPGTMFTSGIVNKNNPLKYHFDAGNFRSVCSCMLGFKTRISGGHLVMPALGIALEIADESLSVFDGAETLHGVTPIVKHGPASTRFTVVYYGLRDMWKCEPLTAEIARIRTIRTARERKRAQSLADKYAVDNNGNVLVNDEPKDTNSDSFKK